MTHRLLRGGAYIFLLTSLLFGQNIMDECLSDSTVLFQYVPAMLPIDTTGMGMTRTVSGECDSAVVTLSGTYQTVPFTIPITFVKQPPCTLKTTYTLFTVTYDTVTDVCTPVRRSLYHTLSGTSALDVVTRNGKVTFSYNIASHHTGIGLAVYSPNGKLIHSFENLPRENGVVTWKHRAITPGTGAYFCVITAGGEKLRTAKFYR
ncbi:MAG: hypothetical protein GF401_03425 [Chitinivibrionales bacterium]|nr:hypothetical protein [Chitinivibrionales bacterium]